MLRKLNCPGVRYQVQALITGTGIRQDAELTVPRQDVPAKPPAMGRHRSANQLESSTRPRLNKRKLQRLEARPADFYNHQNHLRE